MTIWGSSILGSWTARTPPSGPKAPSQPEYDPCSQSPVGGCIVQPTKIADKRPIYPAKQRAASVSGNVEIDARLGTDGMLKDFRLTATADPDFVNALIDALHPWQYTQTRLDHRPVEVAIHVSARFAVE